MPIEPIDVSTAVYTVETDAPQMDKPALAAAGDFLLARLSRGSGSGFTSPAGWNRLGEITSGGPPSVVDWRWCQAGDTDWTWTLDLLKTVSGGIIAFRGVHPTNPIDVPLTWVTGSEATGVTHPGLTVVTAGAMLVGGCGVDSSGKTSTTPGGMTEAFQTNGARNTQGDYQLRASPGATGSRTWNVDDGSVKDLQAFLAALRPAPTVGGGWALDMIPLGG